jgi:hypothetical protein
MQPPSRQEEKRILQTANHAKYTNFPKKEFLRVWFISRLTVFALSLSAEAFGIGGCVSAVKKSVFIRVHPWLKTLDLDRLCDQPAPKTFGARPDPNQRANLNRLFGIHRAVPVWAG